jgi:ubiquinone/menaquinone biosynthesis C-methylase UbiE
MKNNSKRWEIAQNSEKEYWEGFTKDSLLKEEAERHEQKARALEREWSKYVKLDKNSRILQIGCGPEDVINYISAGKKYAIDPLAEFYRKKFGLDYNSISFLEGRAESLPFPDGFFDVVILANVLDHVEQPQKALSEITRVLKKDGLFHFENLFYQKEFILLSSIYGAARKLLTGEIFNIHHPFMFLLKDLKNLIYQDFSVIHEEIGIEIGSSESFEEMKRKKKKEKKLTVKIPATFGLYGIINYTAECRKR